MENMDKIGENRALLGEDYRKNLPKIETDGINLELTEGNGEVVGF